MNEATTTGVHLAVNGTLMRGFPLNDNLVDLGATFVRTDHTAPVYRLWSIRDEHPAMIRVTDESGTSVEVEVWDVPLDGLAQLLHREPEGLALGKVHLADGNSVLGVLAEPALVEHAREITQFGGWRAYLAETGREG